MSNKIAILSVLDFGTFDPTPINLFAGRADQMEELCKRLNNHLLVGCPDTPLREYWDEERQEKIVNNLLMNALLSKEAARRLIDTIMEHSNATLIAEAGSFEIEVVELLQGVF